MQEKMLGVKIFESDTVLNLEIPTLTIRKNKLLFVNGTFEGRYWFEEILLTIEHGAEIMSVEKTIPGQYYEKFIYEFTKNNGKMREISQLHKIIGKNNNNTFYGRLGINPERLKEEILSKIENWKDYEKIIESNGIYLGYKKKEKSVPNITISASITSKARIKLYKGVMNIIKEGGKTLYTDIGSIIAAFKKDKYKIILDKNLGEV